MQCSELQQRLQHSGEMGERIAALDWSSTELGAISRWPQALRTALLLLLHFPQPALMLWGKQQSVFYNDAFIPFVGHSHPDLLGCNAERGLPNDMQVVMGIAKSGLSDKPRFIPDQSTIVERNGITGTIFFDVDSIPIFDEEENPVGVLVVCIETSHRQPLNGDEMKLLQESEKRMRLATEAAVAFTWEVDLATHKLSFSFNVEAVLGFSLPEDGMESMLLIHPDDRYVVDAFHRAVNGGEKYDVEYRLVDPRSGESIWLHSRGHVICDDPGGKRRFIGITQNIDERKRVTLNAEFVAEICTDFAVLATREEIINLAASKISVYLGVSRLCLFEIDDVLNEAQLCHEWNQQQASYSPSASRLSELVDETTLRRLRQGEIVLIHGHSQAIGAQIYAPHFRHDHWRFLLFAQQQPGREWRADQIDLMRELAGCIWLRMERAQAEEALRKSEARYRTLFESIDEGFCIVDVFFDLEIQQWDVRFHEVNPAFEKHSGLRKAIGKTLREIAPDIDSDWFVIFSKVMLNGKPIRFDGYSKILNRWFNIHAFRVGAHDSQRIGIVFNDITEQKWTQDELTVSNKRLKLAIEGSGDGVWDWDIAHGINTFSKRGRQMLGYDDQEFSDRYDTWRQHVHPDDLSRVLAELDACTRAITPSYMCEYRMKCKDGSWKWVLSRGVVVAWDEKRKPLRMTGTMTDISTRKQADEQIWHHANFDMLTGLPNRRLFRDRLDQAVRKAHRTKRQLGLLFIDLDRFKQVNDLLGHDAGDLLLATAAQRLKECVRESDTVARLGGDEFTVIMAELENMACVEQVSQHILDALSRPFYLGNEMIYLSGSIGITLYPSDATTSEELIRKADQAMYAAKSAGKNRFSYFQQSMDERVHLRMKLTGELRNALRDGQLEVRYQPVVEFSGGRIVKAEALLRWHHPSLGLIEPSEFIPLAEESGLINEIGNWVFHEAAACSKRWSATTGSPFQIGVNKSPVQFLSHVEQEDWLLHLEQLGLPKKSISIEITEGLLLHASSHITDQLLAYHAAGIQVAIDDFGTGYSSMAYLKRFDIDYLKIDQSFVHNMEHDANNRTIAESIIVMAHKLGLQVIAEGVETVEQQELLATAGCDYGQGFLFSCAVSEDEFEAMLVADLPLVNQRTGQQCLALPH